VPVYYVLEKRVDDSVCRIHKVEELLTELVHKHKGRIFVAGQVDEHGYANYYAGIALPDEDLLSTIIAELILQIDIPEELAWIKTHWHPLTDETYIRMLEMPQTTYDRIYSPDNLKIPGNWWGMKNYNQHIDELRKTTARFYIRALPPDLNINADELQNYLYKVACEHNCQAFVWENPNTHNEPDQYQLFLRVPDVATFKIFVDALAQSADYTWLTTAWQPITDIQRILHYPWDYTGGLYHLYVND
jgi:hypothetical protein